MDVEAPAPLPDPPAQLGTLGVALGWFARSQGAWPPHAPRLARTVAVADDGIAGGIAAADALADAGVDLLVVEGPPTSAAGLAVLCALLDVEPVVAVGTAGTPDWSALVVAVRDSLPAARAAAGEPTQLAADPVLGHAAGLLAQSAVRRTPVILGTSSTLAAAALVADRLAPGARRWWLAASQAPGPAVRLAYTDLALEPMLDLGLRVPGAAAIALDVLSRGIDIAGRWDSRGPDGV